jgi:tetratricopeptide (TPR) repeat protein
LKDATLAMLHTIARKDEKIKEYIPKIENDPKDVGVYIKIGQRLADIDYFEQSLFILDMATEIDPHNLDAWINKGKAYVALDEFTNALSCFSKATEIDPHNLDAWINKARTNSSLGNYREADACYQKAIDEQPNSFELYNERGGALYDLGEYDNALESYQKSLDLNGTYVVGWLNKGLTLNKKGNYKGAEECYLKALELDPDNISGIRNLANLYSDSLNLYEKALPLSMQLYTFKPNAESATYLAETYIKARRFNKSRYYSTKVLNELAKGDPFYEYVNRFFIMCSYLLEGKISRGAIQVREFLDYWEKIAGKITIQDKRWVFKGLKNAIRNSNADQKIQILLFKLIYLIEGKERDSENIWNMMSEIEQRTDLVISESIRGVRESIVKYSEERIETAGFSGKYVEAYSQLPEDMKNELEHFRENAEDLKEVLELLKLRTSFDTESNLQQARLLAIEGRHKEALEIYDRILNEEPKNIKVLLNKGLSLYRLGKHEAAIEYYDKALRIEPNRIEAIVQKGLALSRLRIALESESCFNKAAQLTPLPGDFEGFLSKGIALNRLKRHEEAIVQLDKALQFNPGHDRALVNKGISLHKLGRYAEANLSYDKALEINANSVLALYNKACALSLEGRVEESLDYLSKATKLDPESKKIAENDEDLANLRNNEWFKSLVS